MPPHHRETAKRYCAATDEATLASLLNVQDWQPIVPGWWSLSQATSIVHVLNDAPLKSIAAGCVLTGDRRIA